MDDLLFGGYKNISVLDVSDSALQTARSRLRKKAADVTWLTENITDIQLPKEHFDIWHDCAVFHFLVTQEARASYKSTLNHSLKHDGYLIPATFAEDDPCTAADFRFKDTA